MQLKFVSMSMSKTSKQGLDCDRDESLVFFLAV